MEELACLSFLAQAAEPVLADETIYGKRRVSRNVDTSFLPLFAAVLGFT